jgi:hypothetical protein
MITLIDNWGYCFCSCADKCVKGKTGSSFRCTKEELEKEGHRIVQLDEKSSDAIRELLTIDGHEKTLDIKVRVSKEI